MGGTKRIIFQPIEGAGGTREFRRLLHLPGASPSVKLRLVSEFATTQESTITPGTAGGGAR